VILKTMADNRVEALAYPTIRRKANVIGEMQMGTNCRLSANSGLPAISVPGGFTPDGLPVGVELLGRAWSEPQLIKLAYAYEQATRHRRPPRQHPNSRAEPTAIIGEVRGSDDQLRTYLSGMVIR
jgi:Asp-tRNA(Asn)/Glu-tRNA(Gln) amidotransferase A subunit family amidase